MLRSYKVAAVVSLATAVLLYGLIERGRTQQASRALHELPRSARAVLRVDIAALRRTPAAKILLDAFVSEEQLSEIEATCGIDPLSALSELIVWVRGPESQPFQSSGLMLRARTIDAAALADCHRKLVEARGGSVVRLEAPTGPLLASSDRRSAIAVLDERSVVTGSVRTVAEAMAVRRGLMPALSERPRIAELWPQVNRDAGLAAALEPPEHWKSTLERVAALSDDASALESAEAMALSIPSGSKQTIEISIDIADPETAQRNAGLIRGWAASPPEALDPPWDAVLRSARVQVSERRVSVTLSVTALQRSP